MAPISCSFAVNKTSDMIITLNPNLLVLQLAIPPVVFMARKQSTRSLDFKSVPLADLGGMLGTRPPYRTQFFHFHIHFH